MQDPRGAGAPRQGLGFAEAMVNAFAENMKRYYRWWGPLGEPMVRGVDAWAEAQRSYLRWLGKASTAGGRPSATPRYGEGESALGSNAQEAQRLAKESAQEAQRIASEVESDAREAERSAGEVQRSSAEELRNTIRESVSRSAAVGQQEPRAGTAAPQETRADTEELPLEDYDSLNVNQVTQRLGELSVEEIERLRDYEAENKARRSLMQRFDTRIRARRGNLEGGGEAGEGSGEGIGSIVRESVRRSEGEG